MVTRQLKSTYLIDCRSDKEKQSARPADYKDQHKPSSGFGNLGFPGKHNNVFSRIQEMRCQTKSIPKNMVKPHGLLVLVS